LTVLTTAHAALYILNNKRNFIQEIENRHGISVTVQASERMQGASFAIERSSSPLQPQKRLERTAVNMEWGFGDRESAGETVEDVRTEAEFTDDDEDERGARYGRSRRRRRGRDERFERVGRNRSPEPRFDEATGNGNGLVDQHAESAGGGLDLAFDADQAQPAQADDAGANGDAGDGREDRGDRRGRRRRRGRRGGRRGREGFRERGDQRAAALTDDDTGGWGGREPTGNGEQPYMGDDLPESGPSPPPKNDWRMGSAQEDQPRPIPGGGPDRPDVEAPAADAETSPTIERAQPQQAAPGPNEPPRQEPARELAVEPTALPGGASASPSPAPEELAHPTRKGWWQRRFSGG
jgi:ribonuclease E